MRHQRRVCLVAWIGLCLLQGTAWGQVKPEDAPTIELQPKHMLKLERSSHSLSFSWDGSRFACNDNRSIRVWDTRTWKQIGGFTDPKDFIGRVVLRPDGQLLAFTSGTNHELHLLDVASGKVLRTLRGHTQSISSVTFSPDGKSLAVIDSDDNLKLWDAESGKDLARFPKKLDGIGRAWPIVFSPDGAILAAASGGDAAVHLLDVNTGKEVQKLLPTDPRFQRGLPELDHLSTGPAFSPNGQFLAAGLTDTNTITVWNVHEGKPQWTLRWPAAPPRSRVVVDRDQRTGKAIPARASSPGIWAVAFSADGRSLVASCCDAQLRVWELATGKMRYRAKNEGCHLAVAPATLLFATADGNEKARQVIVYDFRTCVPPGPPSASLDLEKAWTDLKSDNAPLAYHRIRELVSAPKLAVTGLDKRLPTIRPMPQATIEQLVQDLDNDQFEVRDRARQRLVELGELAKDALSRALKKTGSLEVRKQMQELLDVLIGLPAGDRLRLLRAVEVLETIASPESREVLKRVGSGAPDHLLTREAKAALQRLNTH